MTEQDPQEGILRLEGLISPDLHRYIDPASRVGPVSWGVFFTVAHQICAVLRLHSGGLCFSAGPNRRTILEYLLFLVWLADDGESVVDVLNRSLQNDQKGMATRLRSESLFEQYPEHVRQAVTESMNEPLAPHPDERLLKPGNLIAHYDSRLLSYYAVESRFSHVSLTSIEFFMKSQADGYWLSQSPVPEEPAPCLEFCLHMLSQAMLTFNELLTGRPWAADLAEIAAEYGLDNRRPERRRKDV